MIIWIFAYERIFLCVIIVLTEEFTMKGHISGYLIIFFSV